MLDEIKQANRFKICCHILELARNEKVVGSTMWLFIFQKKKMANLEVFC